MDFHYELLEETRKEIKNIRFFREDVEINAEEYEVIHDYDEAYPYTGRTGTPLFYALMLRIRGEKSFAICGFAGAVLSGTGNLYLTPAKWRSNA